MQYFGSLITAARVAVRCSYPQMSAEHRDQLPPFAFAVASLMQLQPSGHIGVVDACFIQYFDVWSCSYPQTAAEHRV
jgi:hypothetical protein